MWSIKHKLYCRELFKNVIQEAFENCAPLDNSVDLDLVVTLYNLLELLWYERKSMVFLKDETTDFDAHIANSNNFKSF